MRDQPSQEDSTISDAEVNERRFPPGTWVWVLPLLASVLLPGLTRIVGERPNAVRLERAGVMTLLVAITAIVIVAIYYYGFGRRLRWSLGMAAITTLVLLQWPWLTGGGGVLVDAIPVGALADVFSVGAACVMLWLSARLAQDLAFAIVSSTALWLLTIAFIVMAVPYVESSTAERGPAVAGSPDVLLIILDGYPRADVLASGFNFDNSGFLAELEARGFYIADQALANYSFTYASVSTMYEMDYVFDLGPVDSGEETVMRRALGGSSPLVEQFRSNGYKVAFFENAWEGSHCGPAVDLCIRDGILENSIWNLGRTSIFAPFVEVVRPHPFSSVSLNHLEQLGNTVTSTSGETPLLTIAHILLPHTPLLLDAECRVVNTIERRRLIVGAEDKPGEIREFFRDQVTCVNDLVLQQLDSILGSNSDTIVMITGDHGSSPTIDPLFAFETQTPVEIAERMSILSAYRMPGCEEFTYPQITPVNGIRAMTACSLGQDLQPLPDLSRWITPGGERTVIRLNGVIP